MAWSQLLGISAASLWPAEGHNDSLHISHNQCCACLTVALGMVFALAAFGSPLPAVIKADRTKKLNVRGVWAASHTVYCAQQLSHLLAAAGW
jgi:hypothetical protein